MNDDPISLTTIRVCLHRDWHFEVVDQFDEGIAIEYFEVGREPKSSMCISFVEEARKIGEALIRIADEKQARGGV